MCVVSMIVDHYTDKFALTTFNWPNITREEFEELKKEVENMKKILIKAKIYDEENDQPDCSEKEDKIELLRELAEKLDIDLSEI
jgi:hypothetical protein